MFSGRTCFANELKGQGMLARHRRKRLARELYQAVVAQARNPGLYRVFQVADDMSGRFEMVCLHVFIILERLGLAGREADLGREFVDAFFSDMDDVMREMGVGDSTVPKKMRRTSEALYGRLAAYGGAMRSADETALAQALQRNVWGAASADEGGISDYARGFAAYVRATLSHVEAQPDAAFTRRIDVSFLDPDSGVPQADAGVPHDA